VGRARIYKKSVDARRRDRISVVYSVAFELDGYPDEELLKKEGISIIAEPDTSVVYGEKPLCERPVVVGNGPAGMFCALLLAENGYAPIVIEKGDPVDERVQSVDTFYRTRKLDTESNIQYGAGGAGTFSDGKLVTRINDPLCRYVLDRFVQFGAPEEILTLAKPHIGTDKLVSVVKSLNVKIEELGGKIMYRTSLTGFERLSDGTVTAVKTNRGDIPCGAVVLATGNSARDVYKYLTDNGYGITEKALSVGVRIEHRRTDVEDALYGKALMNKARGGDKALAELLGHAEYAYSYRENDRAAYTFCMCPGGEVVCGSSEDGGVVVNGMSRYARNGQNSNCAVCVSVTPEAAKAFGGTMEFCRRIEKKAFALGGGDFKAPVQTVGDFLSGEGRLSAPSRVMPSYMGGTGNFTVARLDSLYPQFVTDMLKKGIKRFAGYMKGFDAPHAILTGAETRTSAPYRILRNEIGVCADAPNLYPCGEGAGYAGGITSSAVDGLKAAKLLMSQYAPITK
jgi:uncharacterized FAD-dependent dehydrogenase